MKIPISVLTLSEYIGGSCNNISRITNVNICIKENRRSLLKDVFNLGEISNTETLLQEIAPPPPPIFYHMP